MFQRKYIGSSARFRLSPNEVVTVIGRQLVALLIGMLVGSTTLLAQTAQRVSFGSTPPGIEGGAAAGSFALSGFESVNLFNGHLNFALPLLQIGGRGEAGYTMVLKVEHQWDVETQWFCGSPDCGQYEFDALNTVYSVANFTTVDVGYGPGLMSERTGMISAFSNGSGCAQPEGNLVEWKKLTRLTFTMPDGSEISLRDVLTEGKPSENVNLLCTSPLTPTRGRVFMASDGSGTMFVSDSSLNDGAFAKILGSAGQPSLSGTGNLTFRNGVLYRIEQGLVRWIRDRNGNVVRFQYETGSPFRLTSITDSLDRVVTITYAATSCASGATTCDKIVYFGASGTQREIEISKAVLSSALDSGSVQTYQQLFPQSELGGYQGAQNSTTFSPNGVVSGVRLPNGRSYSFRYSARRELEKVTLPTGGVIEYDWGPGPGGTASGVYAFSSNPRMIYRRVVERRTKPDGVTIEGTTTFSASSLSTTPCEAEPPFGTSCTVVVAKHYNGAATVPNLLAQERHTFQRSPTESTIQGPIQYSSWRTGREFLAETLAPNDSVLRKVQDTWAQRALVPWWTGTPEGAPPNDPRITQTDTTLISGAVQRIARQTFSYSADRFNNRTDMSETDYGASSPGSILRRIHFEFNTLAAYTASNLLADPTNTGLQLKTYLPSLRSREWICGSGTGNCVESAAVAKTEFDYDVGGLVQRTGIVGYQTTHVPANFQVATERGNATTIRRWRDQPSSVWLSEQRSYDVAGNVTSVTDPNTNTTTISYNDDFSDGLNRNTFAFPTGVTPPVPFSFATQTKYDYRIGRPTTFIDENGASTTFSYGDSLDRLTQAVTGDGGATVFAFDDTTPKVTTTRDQNSCGFTDDIKTIVVWDGFGRQKESQQFENATAFIGVRQEYDGMGRVRRVSNPFRGSPADWTTTSYDALNRVSLVTHPDGATVSSFYEADRTIVRDPAGNRRLSRADALGRLVEVIEDPACQSWETGCPSGSHLAYTTSYTYDPLDNLRTVSQSGQSRSFAYDSLSRLLCASNPESRVGTPACSTPPLPTTGLNRFSYDNNGNLTSKTDARAVTVSQTYDALNRLKTKTYSGSPAAPAVRFCYDGQTFNGSVCVGTIAIGKKGRLTEVNTDVSYTRFNSFDAVGRVTTSVQTTDGGVYGFSYTYNKAGGLETATYPSGRKIETCHDPASRVSSLKDIQIPQTPKTYASSFSYTPHGAIASMALGNSRVEQGCYNSRLQPVGIRLGSGTTTNCANASDLLNLAFGYGASNNGNVMTQTLLAPSFGPLTQTYGYDQANRLASAGETGWSQSYSYDAFGNRAATGSNIFANTPQSTTAYTASTNRLTTTWADYDAAGNLTWFKPTGFVWSAAYDAENRQIRFCSGATSCGATSPTAEFRYDGENRRVQKITATTTTTYVYDVFGQLAAEYSNAVSGATGTFYRTTDHLGSTRLVTNGASPGAVVSRGDFFPFGEQIPASATFGNRQLVTDGQPQTTYNVALPFSQKFTAKERDDESGLDYFGARYFGSSLGRFTSPDIPFADQVPPNPQSWNLYAYVRNSPLRFVDPSGNACLVRDDGSTFDDDSGGQTCAEVEADPVGGEVTTTSATVPLTDLPGQFFVGFGEFFFNGQPQGAIVAFNALAAGVATEVPLLALARRGQVFKSPGFKAAALGGKIRPALSTLSPKIVRQMQSRGWTKKQIIEAFENGQQFKAINKFDGANTPATRYVHPTTGRSVVIDDASGEVIQVAADGFLF